MKATASSCSIASAAPLGKLFRGSGDGRSIADAASRVDDARFSAAAKAAKPSTHPGHGQAKRVEVQAVVPASSEAILGCRKTMEESLGKIPRFTPHPAASTGYLIALAGTCAAAALLLVASGGSARAQTEPPRKLTWHPLEFAILRYNDDAPKSWNIYHSEKKGVLLVRLWKRYLLVIVPDEEVYDIDPQTIKASGDAVEWSYADRPPKPMETPDWRVRNVGSMDRVRFRLGKDGHFLELQLPLGPNGRPIY